MSDLRIALRLFFRQRSFSAAAALTLAIGIASPTAIFSVVQAVLLRPLPVANPERIVTLQTLLEDSRRDAVFSLPDYLDYQHHTADVMAVAAQHLSDVTVRLARAPQVTVGVFASGNYFDVLGLHPAVGRFFNEQEARVNGAAPVAVLSHETWAALGADPSTVGGTVHVNGQPLTIIGIAPEGFHGTFLGAMPMVYLPLGLRERLQPDIDIRTRGRTDWLRLFARLRDGVSMPAAESRASVVARQLGTTYQYPRGVAPRAVRLDRFGGLSPSLQDAGARFLGLLQAAALLVLVIAIINVAGMLTARAAGRRREFGVRMAMGAGRLRLARQMLSESATLVAAGGAGGLLLASWLVDWLRSIRPPFAGSFSLPLGIDIGVLAFVGTVMTASTIALGAIPSLQGGADVVSAIREAPAPSGRRRLRGAFVVVQLALSVLLLVTSGLLVRTLQTALAIEHGFEPQGVLAFELDLRLGGYDEARGRTFYGSLIDRLEASPDIDSAALANIVPLGLSWDQTRLRMPGIEAPEPDGFAVGFNVVSPEYFETIRMPLVAGRTFTDADASSQRNVAIINEAFARRFWPDGSAVGQRVRLAGSDTEIIGVVPDGKYRSFSESQRFYAYFPVGRRYDPDLWLHVRARGDSTTAAAAVRAALRDLDPDVAPISVEPMDRLMESTLFLQRLGARVVGGFGLAALLLAAVGLFGVLSFTVGQRTREIGVRIALGAAPRDAALLVVRQGLMLVVVGIVAGLALAVPASRAMRVLLENLSPHDPVTIAAVVMVFVAAGLGAAYLPARRATRVDPATALRAE